MGIISILVSLYLFFLIKHWGRFSSWVLYAKDEKKPASFKNLTKKSSYLYNISKGISIVVATFCLLVIAAMSKEKILFMLVDFGLLFLLIMACFVQRIFSKNITFFYVAYRYLIQAEQELKEYEKNLHDTKENEEKVKNLKNVREGIQKSLIEQRKNLQEIITNLTGRTFKNSLECFIEVMKIISINAIRVKELKTKLNLKDHIKKSKNIHKDKKVYKIGIVTFLLLIPFFVIPHETAHMLAFKSFGIKVKTYSVGFGPKLLEKKIGETNYRLSLIPLGGYVETNTKQTNKMPYWQWVICVGAGPLSTILLFLPLFFYFKRKNNWKAGEVNLVYSFWQHLTFFFLVLGLLNLLPLGPLDGGQLFQVTYYKLFGKMPELMALIYKGLSWGGIFYIFFSTTILNPFKRIWNYKEALYFDEE